jgi:hypothetical protein
MNTKFTKGNWFACFGSYEVAVLNKKGSIETLITDTGPSTIPDDIEAKANQDLIAAAPDMYEKLKEMAELLTMLDPLTHPNIELDCQVYEIEQLLTKARGKLK